MFHVVTNNYHVLCHALRAGKLSVDLLIPIVGIVNFRQLKNLVKKMEEEIRQLRSTASKEAQRRKKNKIPCTIV